MIFRKLRIIISFRPLNMLDSYENRFGISFTFGVTVFYILQMIIGDLRFIFGPDIDVSQLKGYYSSKWFFPLYLLRKWTTVMFLLNTRSNNCTSLISADLRHRIMKWAPTPRKSGQIWILKNGYCFEILSLKFISASWKARDAQSSFVFVVICAIGSACEEWDVPKFPCVLHVNYL